MRAQIKGRRARLSGMALLIAGALMLALAGITRLVYNIQGVCLLIAQTSGESICSSGYTSDSLTVPLASIEFLFFSVGLTVVGLFVWILNRHS